MGFASIHGTCYCHIEDKYGSHPSGMEKDIEDIMMPKTKVDNFFKRIRGQRSASSI